MAGTGHSVRSWDAAQSLSVKNATQITEIVNERRNDQGERINSYRRFLGAYKGQTESGTLAVQANYADGRPAMRYLAQAHSDMLSRRGAPNFAYPVIRDLSAIYGALPDARVKPESGADTDTAIKRTRILQEQYEHSKMGTKASRIGFFAACLGDAVCTLDPILPSKSNDDPEEPPGIYVNVVNPAKCFPAFVGGEDSRDLDDLVIVDYMTVETAVRRYEDFYSSLDDREMIEVCTFYSRDQKAVVIDKKIIEGVTHNLGFVPAQWFSKEITDGKLAQGDLAQAIDLAYELQALYYTFVDSVVASTYPILVVKGGQAALGQDSVEQGPGARVDVSVTGDVKYIQPEGNPQAAQIVFQAALDNFMKVVGVSPIRTEGQIQHANTSSKALQAAQAPMQSRVNQAYILLGECYEAMNSKILRMLYKIPEFSKGKGMSLYGSDQNGVYNEVYTGKDVGGWSRNEVTWDNFLGASKTERLHNALMLFKSNPAGFPWQKVLQEYGLEDPQEIIAEAQAQASLQGQPPQGGAPGQLQAPGAPPPPGAGPSLPSPPGGGVLPPGAGEGPSNAGPPPDLTGGGAPPGPTQPQMPDFPQMSTPPNAGPTPAPLPDLGGDIQKAIQSVQLFGEIVDGPRPTPGGIYVEVTDHRDVRPVKDALLPVAHTDIGPSAVVKVVIKKPARKAK